MKALNEREWRTKFIELPLLLKIVVAWVYFISILNFLKFFAALIMRLSLDVFALAFGYLIWELASGLVGRNNFARVIALVWLGLSAVFRIYVAWNGGTVLIEDFKLSTSYSGSIFWIIACCSSVLILLLPQVRRLFSNSTQEEKTQ
jgi:hypothetical protein